jgi:hypothetical protein
VGKGHECFAQFTALCIGLAALGLMESSKAKGARNNRKRRNT